MRRFTANGTKRTLAALLLIVLFGGSESRSEPLYTITGLGTLPGTSESVAMGINASGQVVGISYNSADGSLTNAAGTAGPPTFNQNGDGGQSFLYSNGQMTQITPTGGLATAINDSGQVVGGSYTSINDVGQYVGGPAGLVNPPNPLPVGQMVSAGATTILPLIPYAINNAGEVAGFIGIGQDFHVATVQGGQLQDLYPTLFAGTGYFDTRAIAINQAGDLLIKAGSETTLQTYLYNATTQALADISTLPGGTGTFGAALNDKDQVVGNGFLYSNGSIVSLTSLLPTGSGWSNLNALGINDAGQIVGQGLYNGQEQAFLMSPAGALPVPEPGTLVTWGVLPMSLILQRIARRMRG